MRYLLINNGNDIKATEKEKYEFITNIAEGKMEINEIKDWIKSHIV